MISTGHTRTEVAEAIRTFCRSLGEETIQNSHGVERIYYAGISVDALSCAVTLALNDPNDKAVAWPTENQAKNAFEAAYRESMRAHSDTEPSLARLEGVRAIIALYTRPDVLVKALEELTAHVDTRMNGFSSRGKSIFSGELLALELAEIGNHLDKIRAALSHRSGT